MARSELNSLRQRLPENAGKVLDLLRKHIVTGKMPPGERFPTRLEMRAKYKLAAETVQKIFNSLIQDGFATPRGMAGTFVSQTPPHLTSVGLVFAGLSANWSRFDTALFNEASSLEDGRNLKLRIYRKVHYPSNYVDHIRLLEDVAAWRVGGLIFINPPRPETIKQILERAPTMPCVSIWDQPEFPHVAAVALGSKFTTKAMEYFASRQRQRVAFLNTWSPLDFAQQFDAALLAEAEAHGLTTQPQWMLQVHLDAAPSAQDITHLLFSNPEDRPDAFFITDDNLVEHATRGLLAAGVRVPEDVEVVAHANFPWPTPSAVLAQRLGYDAREIIQNCLDVLARIRNHADVSAPTLIPARFAHEVETKPSPLTPTPDPYP